MQNGSHTNSTDANSGEDARRGVPLDNESPNWIYLVYVTTYTAFFIKLIQSSLYCFSALY